MGLSHTFGDSDLREVLNVYTKGVQDVFLFAIAGCMASVLIAAILIRPTRLPDHGSKNIAKEAGKRTGERIGEKAVASWGSSVRR